MIYPGSVSLSLVRGEMRLGDLAGGDKELFEGVTPASEAALQEGSLQARSPFSGGLWAFGEGRAAHAPSRGLTLMHKVVL